MNKVIISGRVVRDADVRYSQTANGSMAVARYTLAVDRTFKKEGEQAADFISCIAFGKNGEFAEKYLHQGTKIIVEGRWQTGNYTNKDGRKIYTNDCVVERHEFCESRANQQNNSNGIIGRNSPSADSDSFMSIPDGIGEELPLTKSRLIIGQSITAVLERENNGLYKRSICEHCKGYVGAKRYCSCKSVCVSDYRTATEKRHYANMY